MENQWAIVELMGHNRIAGLISEEEVAGTKMLRVDVPETEGINKYTKFFGSSALYAITPTDEDTAKRAVVAFRAEPISPWILNIELPALPNSEEEDELYLDDSPFGANDDWLSEDDYYRKR